MVQHFYLSIVITRHKISSCDRIVIGESVGGSGSSLKLPSSKDDKGDKRKGIEITPYEEEKRKNLEMEMERQRQINNILRLRQNDPPGLNKGDPNKIWCYETIEQVVSLGKMDYF